MLVSRIETINVKERKLINFEKLIVAGFLCTASVVGSCNLGCGSTLTVSAADPVVLTKAYVDAILDHYETTLDGDGSGVYFEDRLSGEYTFKIPEGFTEIDDNTFSGCPFTKIIIPNSVTKIGKSAFSDCKNLFEVVNLDSVNEVGEAAFAGCKCLIKI